MPIPLPSIASMWTSYRWQVMPPAAPAIQVRECRRAFYAGAAALLLEAMVCAGTLPNEGGAQYLDECERELQQFKLDVEKGIA